MKDGINVIDKGFKDNYNLILPVFRFSTEETSKSILSQSDRAIKKSALVIQNHSMLIKGKEYNNWVPESYILMGTANFYKGDYHTAIEIFKFLLVQYPERKTRFEAMIWLANSYIKLKKYSEAQTVFNILEDGKSQAEMPNFLFKWVYLSKTQLAIATKDYPLAIEQMNKALDMNKSEKFVSKQKFKEHIFLKYKFNRKRLCRYYFILAQLTEKVEEFDKASMLYGQVLKYNPTYEMSFYAKINRAKLYNTKTGNADVIIKDLRKMAEDIKNKDYLDQIYYALAEIAFKQNKQALAIDYLKKSSAYSTSNTYQKAMSCLRLANLYFEMPDYMSAQMYYDSTILAPLPKDYQDYSIYVERKNVLTKLANSINSISREDSLQRLAKMTPAQRDEVVGKIIKKIIEQEELIKAQELQAQQMLSTLQQNAGQSTGGGSWYFDNASAVSFGKQEFAKKWGTRKLEDNWRRVNKEVIADFGSFDNAASVDTATAVSSKSNPKDKSTYLKNIPLTKQMLDESNKILCDAFYSAGLIFRQELNDLPKSTKYFEELNSRYPENKYLLEALYRLYRNNVETKNTVKADFYKNAIITKFPESDYAKMLINPDAFRQSKEKEDNVSKLYKATYDAYQSGSYDVVLKNSQTAVNTYPSNLILPKFYYLSALSQGMQKDTADMRKQLDKIIEKYPSTAEAKDAKSIVNYMKNPQGTVAAAKTSLKTDKQAAQNLELYTYNENSIHFFGMYVSVQGNDINKLKIAISDFNMSQFSTGNLTVNAIYVDDKHQLINVTNFKSADEAKYYFDALKKKNIFSKVLKVDDSMQFVISAENYTRLYKQKDFANYMKFYSENYK